ncbi:MAG TPA: GNAT family N-acetyltransferase [Pseudobdellovibrionaceae bacterium]|nr:GNAT family N-acetyltransferase [Pseudobdellovibrionaceae bacterium]
MKLFAAYLKERTGQTLIEREGGFATYQIDGEECYIVEIFVVPEIRRTGLASRMADEISVLAKSQNCTYLKGTVDLRANGARESILALIGYGFKPVRAVDEILYFRKEL